MRSTVAAGAGLLLAIAATTASAGVVISQDVVDTDLAGKQHKSEVTVMLQGNKQKIVLPARAIITDLDAGKVIVLIPGSKGSASFPLPPPPRIAMLLSRFGMFVGYQKASGGGKVAGYECQNYTGSDNEGRLKIDATACVASAAAGAAEYTAFGKGLAAKLKGSHVEIKGDVPDGVPVSSTLTIGSIPPPIPKGFPPEQAAKVKESEAKLKPVLRSAKVTKIEVKDLPADTFMVPADYNASAPGKPAAGAKPAAAASAAH